MASTVSREGALPMIPAIPHMDSHTTGGFAGTSNEGGTHRSGEVPSGRLTS